MKSTIKNELAKWALGASIVGTAAYTFNHLTVREEMKKRDPCATKSAVTLQGEHKSLRDLTKEHEREFAWFDYREAIKKAEIQYFIDIGSNDAIKHIEAQIEIETGFFQRTIERHGREFLDACKKEYPTLYGNRSEQVANKGATSLAWTEDTKEIFVQRCALSMNQEGYAPRQSAPICDCIVASLENEFGTNGMRDALQAQPNANGSAIEQRLHQALSMCKNYLK